MNIVTLLVSEHRSADSRFVQIRLMVHASPCEGFYSPERTQRESSFVPAYTVIRLRSVVAKDGRIGSEAPLFGSENVISCYSYSSSRFEDVVKGVGESRIRRGHEEDLLRSIVVARCRGN